MGGLFRQGGLTTPDSALLNSNGSAAMVGDPSKMRDIDFQTHSHLHPYLPGTPNPNPELPSVGTPSFQEATTAGATPGGANALSPGLNKAGKLITLLTSGLQGAMAGRAASEQTVAQSGGRRSGGAGTGFEAGYTLPWQRAQQQLGLQQQQAQVDLTKAQGQMVPTQYGPLPAALARYILPAQIRGEATENAATTRAGATTQAAQIGAGSRVQGAQIGADARIKAAQMGLGPMADVSPELQQQLGLPPKLPLKMLNQAESAANRPLTTVAGENDSYVVNKETGAKTPLGVGNRGAGAVGAGLVPVADPDNPGNVTYARRSNAVGKQSPQGAATQAAKTEARSEVPTKIGDQKVAFNTALQHADLLKSAVTALGNGDVQTLNALKNRFKNEFGSTGPLTAEVIADAYSREVTKGLSAGHMTDSEISTIGKTLNVNRQSPQQALAALDAYKALFTGKMKMLTNQANAAKGAKNTPPQAQPEDPFAKFGGKAHP